MLGATSIRPSRLYIYARKTGWERGVVVQGRSGVIRQVEPSPCPLSSARGLLRFVLWRDVAADANTGNPEITDLSRATAVAHNNAVEDIKKRKRKRYPPHRFATSSSDNVSSKFRRIPSGEGMGGGRCIVQSIFHLLSIVDRQNIHPIRK